MQIRHLDNASALVVRATQAELVWLSEYLSFANKGTKHSGAPERTSLLNRYNHQLPAGALPLVRAAAPGAGYVVEEMDRPHAPVACDVHSDLAWLRDYQLEAVLACCEHARGIVWIPTAGGKCLAPGTGVLRADGVVVPVEAIVTGDQLAGPGGPRTVTSTTAGRGALFTITPARRAGAFTCNADHVLTLVHTETGVVVDIAVRDYLQRSAYWRHCHKLYTVGVPVFTRPPAALPVSPYFLGVWIGDGRKDLRQGVQVSKPDAEIEAACRDEAARFGLTVVVDRYKTCPTYRLIAPRGQPNPLKRAMQALMGTQPHVPDAYKYGSEDTRRQTLAGLLDTDGHRHHCGYDFLQKSEAVVRDAVFIARSLGLSTSISTKTVPGYGIYWRARISGACGQLPLRIPRKQPSQTKKRADPCRTGFTVAPAGSGTYHGFTLDGDGRFLLGDFTVTHNTEVAVAMPRCYPCPWLLVVHRANLVEQAAARYELRTPGMRAGRVGDGTWDVPADTLFIAATFDTLSHGLARRDPKVLALLAGARGLMVDEAHTLAARTFGQVVAACRNAYWRLGFSGTPLQRLDQKSLLCVAALGPIIYRVRPERLFAAGVMARPAITMVRCPQGVQTDSWAGVYRAAVVRSERRNALVLAMAKRCAKPALVFVKERAHGTALLKAIERAGFNARFVWGKHGTDERERAKRDLAAGRLDVVVCSVVFQEGIDVPELAAIVVAAGGESAVAALQRVGRGARGGAAAGKPTFEVWDVYDLHVKWVARHARERRAAYEAEGYAVTIADAPVVS